MATVSPSPSLWRRGTFMRVWAGSTIAPSSWIVIVVLDFAPLFPKLVALVVVGLTGVLDYGLGTL